MRQILAIRVYLERVAKQNIRMRKAGNSAVAETDHEEHGVQGVKNTEHLPLSGGGLGWGS